jgi:hypothetical protein
LQFGGGDRATRFQIFYAEARRDVEQHAWANKRWNLLDAAAGEACRSLDIGD